VKIKHRILGGIALGILLFQGCVSAQEKEIIRWLTWEQVPNFITQGKYAGQGIGDAFTKILQSKLPQYEHQNIISNTRRYNELIRKQNTCVAWAWTVPGSNEYRIHSRPVSLAPRTGILTLKSKQHLFGEPGETLSLAKLLNEPNIVLGYLEEMQYSKKVHELISQYKETDRIFVSSRRDVEFDLKVLDKNHLDYFFGFPAQAAFEAKIKNIPNKYQFYNIEEIEKYVSMSTHCSRNDFGSRVMEDVNRILTDEILMEHLAVVERWYGENKSYRDVFIDYVIKRNPNELVTHPGL